LGEASEFGKDAYGVKKKRISNVIEFLKSKGGQ